MSSALHHFYHIYADGDWEDPVEDHIRALRYGGLYENLQTLAIGFVGSSDNIARVQERLTELGVEWVTVALSLDGWEQETLRQLYDFAQHNEGYVSYAHTKGAANFAEINVQWRKSMDYFNFCDWETVVGVLDSGVKIAGCHWIAGSDATNPRWGTGGMFGGNFWWTTCEVIRKNAPPGECSRYHAEHWLGQLSEVMDMRASVFIHDLNPGPIAEGYLKTDW